MARHRIVFEGIELFTLQCFNPLTEVTTADYFLKNFLEILERSGPEKGSIENFSSLVKPRVGKIMDFLEELG